VPALDGAAERLLATGLFARLSYRYRTKGDEGTVTFEVEESKRETSAPVVFDNFIWFTDEELSGAVRRELPTFDGKASDAGGAIAAVTRALERLLRERKIAGRVEYMPSADASGANAKHVFGVRGAGATAAVCALAFPGASAIPEKELVEVSAPLFQTDYSREFVEGFADGNLKPLYWQRGHLRARFGRPQATAGAAGNCKGGASVSVPVEEGLAYAWERAVWAGNAALAAAQLDAALGMKAGEIADGVRISKALGEVRKAYGRRGYLFLNLKPRQEFADAERRVTYHFDVAEGPQFRMGALAVNGLPAPDANRLKGLWTLRAGEVYDASYVDEFLKQNLQSVVRAGVMRRVDTTVKPDREKLTVDVTVEFK
jgi:outer membrane protein assembly factor BamA